MQILHSLPGLVFFYYSNSSSDRTELFQDIESLLHELGVLRGKEDIRELELLEVGCLTSKVG